MTPVERLGLLAAQCDVAAARATTPSKRALYKIVAAIHRRKQIACLTKLVKRQRESERVQ